VTSPNLAHRLRAIVESLTPGPGIGPDDRDLLELKRILLTEAAALESEHETRQGKEEKPEPAEKHSSNTHYDN
jgi:hypothetical protein